MTSGIKTFIYPVKDLARAKALFTSLLGIEPQMDEPYYVQYNVAGQEIGLDPQGHGKGMAGPAGYWYVDDIEESLRRLLDAGAEIQQEITDFGGGNRRVASVKDADGNIVGLIQQD